jgi:hypothetical protein
MLAAAENISKTRLQEVNNARSRCRCRLKRIIVFYPENQACKDEWGFGFI